MTIDIGNFYTNTPMDRYKYMRIHISKIPPEIIDEYNQLPKVCDGYVYFCIKKAIYGLKQSDTLAAKMLVKILNKRGYYQAKHTKGLWLHKTKNISFTLVVNNFGVKYICREDAEELVSILEETYPCKCDWSGKQYIGVHLKWDYKRRRLNTLMPGYVKRALTQFQHIWQGQKQSSPSLYTPSDYSKRCQMTNIDLTTAMNPKDKKNIYKKRRESSCTTVAPSLIRWSTH